MSGKGVRPLLALKAEQLRAEKMTRQTKAQNRHPSRTRNRKTLWGGRRGNGNFVACI